MIIEIIILFLAVPVGILIARLTRDEMKDGRKYFQIIEFISIIGAIVFSFLRLPYISYTFGFILIVSIISSQRAKKTRKRSFK